MANTTQKEYKGTPFSEEDACLISKRDPCAVLSTTKFMYSGLWDGTPQQASGYNFQSGESDVEPMNPLSGFGQMRIPELNQLAKLFVFPKNPRIVGRIDYQVLTLGVTSGLPTGDGGCSGKVALVHWMYVCSGCSNLSGEPWTSGVNPGAGGSGQADGFQWNSGLVDVIAFGSEY